MAAVDVAECMTPRGVLQSVKPKTLMHSRTCTAGDCHHKARNSVSKLSSDGELCIDSHFIHFGGVSVAILPARVSDLRKVFGFAMERFKRAMAVSGTHACRQLLPYCSR